MASVFREWQATPVKSTIVDYYYDVGTIPFPVVVLTADQVTSSMHVNGPTCQVTGEGDIK